MRKVPRHQEAAEKIRNNNELRIWSGSKDKTPYTGGPESSECNWDEVSLDTSP